jgi:hypothetical protein
MHFNLNHALIGLALVTAVVPMILVVHVVGALLEIIGRERPMLMLGLMFLLVGAAFFAIGGFI